MIETKSLCATSSNYTDMLAIVTGWTILILEVKVTIDMNGNKLVCFFVELGRHNNHCERINPIASGGHMSKFKVILDL